MNHIKYMFLIVYGLLVFSFPVISHAENWSLLTHVDVQSPPLSQLTEAQSEWIKNKRRLVVGIQSVDTPPYGMRTLSSEYEGLSADFLSQVAGLLGMSVELVSFQNDEQIWQALSSGKIDLISSVTASLVSNNFVASTAFAWEQPVIAVKSKDSRESSAELNGLRIAMAADYLPLSAITRAYPQSQVQIFDTYQEALSAVAYGNAQAYIGNSYSVGRNYVNNLRIDRLAALPEREISFALRKDNLQLLQIINLAIKNVPLTTRMELQQYWQTGTQNGAERLNQSLKLTPDEQEWIKLHPEVKVILYGDDDTAPAAFLDQTGNVRGLAVDILAIAGLKTGLRFSFQPNSNMESLTQEIKENRADMVAALAPSQERQKDLNFSYPFTRSAFALITANKNSSIRTLSDLRGKRLAVIKKAALAKFISTRYPEIKLIYYDNDDELFSSVIKGEADALVGVLFSAEYQISNRYRGELKIVNTVGSNPAYFSFATGKSNFLLNSILNKVLMAIPPNELEILANRWRPNNLIVIDSFWHRHRFAVISLALGAGLVLLAISAWLLWLRRQVEKGNRLRQKMKEQLQTLERLMDGLPFPMALRDRQLKLIYANHLYTEHMHQPYEKLLGRTLAESSIIRTAGQIVFFEQMMQKVIDSGSPYHADHDIELTSAEQSGIAVSVWLLPWYDAQDNITGVLTAIWDISERQKLITQLSDAMERAEASNRAKSTFLSTMSHEIRTPMNAIIGMLDMAIKQGKKGDIDWQALEIAHDSALGLVGLIGDILDLSRIEGTELKFRPEIINLDKLITQLLVIFNGLASDKNIALVKIFPQQELVSVLGDPLRIKQVISNLLGNAIKFTDSGTVTLSVEQKINITCGEVTYVVEVNDSGIGIAEEQQASLFRPFTQADNHRSGTGLGLYISRNLCKAMRGDLTLQSVLNQGTRVRAEFTLPLALQEKPEDQEVIIPEKKRTLSVLVVDDNGANRILLAKQLAWLGHHAHVSEDASEAYELWSQKEFDMIITDCNMPGMNGYQLAQKIRQAEHILQRKKIYILGFTANAMQEIVERCHEAGMNGCLFKPYSLSQLSEALNI